MKKTLKFPKPKKKSRTYLKKKADKLFADLIKKNGCCINCGKSTNLQCAHIFSRRYLATRWALDNALVLCSGCHIWFTYHPIEWEVWVIGIIGQNAYEGLKKRALPKVKIDYEEIIHSLEKQL